MTHPSLTPRFACALIVLALAAPPAHAANKDMVQLQTQVQELQTAVANLQQSNAENMGVLKDLVQQTTDSVNKMSLSISTLQQQLVAQHDSTNAKIDQFSTQMQTLSDSLDEVKARLNNLEKGMKSVQDQQQSIDAALQNLAPPNPAAPGAATQPTDNSVPPTQPTGAAPLPNSGYPMSVNTPSPVAQGANANSPASPASRAPLAAPGAPSAATLYKTALSDYMAASYQMAASEFAEIVRSYPTDPSAGNSLYYLGEIDFRSGKYAAAIKDYDRVLTQFPNNPKVPVSYLHKAQALLETGKREAGITQLRALITRFPNSPEANQARAKLNGMGVPIIPRRSAQ
ncbi:MAG: tetratricopeptide repeat protein [Acidobacteriaceae bacterium]